MIVSTICACSSEPKADKANEQSQSNQNSQAQKRVTIDTPHGVVSLPANPHPLVVYDWTVLQNLVALGVSVEGIPEKSVFNDATQQITDNAKIVGTVFEPDLEALNNLEPQAILIGNRMAKKYDVLHNIAPTLDLSMSFADLHTSSQQQLQQLGKLFNKSAQAQQLQTDIDNAIQTTAAITHNKGNGLVLSVKGKSLSTFGVNSRYGYIHKDFGIAIADPNIGSNIHGQPISFEFIHQVNPDWIFLLDYNAIRDAEGKNAYAMLDNALIHQTKAWRKQQIVYLSPESYLAFGSYYHWINDAQRIQDAFKNAPIVTSNQL
ncbi:siderophore ABC transporter substrate-binding protein [Psychrobacter sp. I-STPA10]|uniref:siderophore ABC transporter substrate-binding protein n=1 Tax=Psychrobacter sp. I-STPA10 TaxID=2585769 RepID=UPI001E5FF15E|nr:ABC transporter substrate-binding protein [Psychrobacter sp. I-STPA10]